MKGITLVELMAVVLISSLILAGTFSVLTMGKKSWQIGTTQVEVQQKARRAMDAIVKELRGASSIDPSSFINGVSDDIIRFTLQGGTIEFAVNTGQLQRTAASTTTTLVDNIGGIQFNLLGGNVVYITLTTQKSTVFGHPVETTLNSRVVLRN